MKKDLLQQKKERYLGNKKTKEVHDLQNEKPECKIEEIIQSGDGVPFRYFFESKIMEFTICNYCFGVFIEVVKQTPQ